MRSKLRNNYLIQNCIVKIKGKKAIIWAYYMLYKKMVEMIFIRFYSLK